MTRLRGRAPVGERLICKTPCGHWQTTTIISAIRLGGACATGVFDAPADTDVFVAYVQQVLLPQLSPGDVVVLDNLKAHKVTQVAALIASAQASVVYLPPYSPDFNPIECMWSKVKASVRATAARTFDTLVEAVGQAMAQVTPADCQGYFQNCGYAT